MGTHPNAELGIPERVFREIVDLYDAEGKDRCFRRPNAPLHQYRCRQIQGPWGQAVILVHYWEDNDTTLRSLELSEVRGNAALEQIVARHERLFRLWFRQTGPNVQATHEGSYVANYLQHPLLPLIDHIGLKVREQFHKLGLTPKAA